MFCEQCGARLSDGARFCEQCGAPVVEVAPRGDAVSFEIPVPQGATVTISDEPPAEFFAGDTGNYARASSLTEAAQIAARRAEEWCPWDDARRPLYHDERWLMRKARQEDRRYDGTHMPWLVSPDGAIGVIGEEGDFEEYGRDIEWWYFTPAVPYADLPISRREIGL